MLETASHLPAWLADRKYCTVKHLMRLFDVSRPTIDRWCRDNPDFPKKLKLGVPGNDYYSTRFVVAEVDQYVASLEHRAEISDAST